PRRGRVAAGRPGPGSLRGRSGRLRTDPRRTDRLTRRPRGGGDLQAVPRTHGRTDDTADLPPVLHGPPRRADLRPRGRPRRRARRSRHPVRRGRIVGGAGSGFALTTGVGFIPLSGPPSLALQERIAAGIDRRLMALTAAVPNREVQDRPEYLSKLRLLLDDRFSMNVVMTAFVGVV